MISRYLATLGFVVVLLSVAASTMRFATRSQVPAGQTIAEAFQLDFTLNADNSHTYTVTPRLKQALQEGVTFPTDGAVRVVSSSVEITPKDVSWSEGDTHYTSAGAGLTAQVHWDTSPDAANGANGKIFVHFPEVSGLPDSALTFHSGNYQKDDQGRFVVRDVNAYRGAIPLFFARFALGLAIGMPIGAVLHTIWWIFVLKKEKRARIAALPPRSPQLPWTFYANPIAEWVIWTVLFGCFSLSASIMAAVATSDGFLGSSMAWIIYGMQGAGALSGGIIAYYLRVRALTVRVDSNGISYARGRENPRWFSAHWTDVQQLFRKSRTYRGTRREWVEIQFKDGRKKLKLPEDMVDYPALRDFVWSLFTPQK